jgi:hypothetical protein
MIFGDETAPADAPTPVDYALDQFATSLDHLIKVVEVGGLDYFDDLQLSPSCRHSSGFVTGCHWSTTDSSPMPRRATCPTCSPRAA